MADVFLYQKSCECMKMLYQENTKKVRKFGLKFPKDRNNLPTFGAVQDMFSVITDFVNLNKSDG